MSEHDGLLWCDNCNYDGKDGWSPVVVDQDARGNNIDAWACPECGLVVCVGPECPPDEFGQRLS